MSEPSNTVTFTTGPPPPPPTAARGFIDGTITDDTTGSPIRSVQVMAYRNSSMGRTTFTDSTGFYRVEVDTGRYFVNANKLGYMPEWYDNSPTFSGATLVPVAMNATSVANFGLSHAGPPAPHLQGTIAGTVVDDSTGNPIRGARIRFYRPNGFFSFRDRITDSLGMYSALLDTGRYLVFATKFGYRSEFFDNAPTVQGATPVPVTPSGNSTADFGLSPMPIPPPPVMVNISGTVRDSASGLPLANAFVAIVRTPQGLNTIQSLNGMPGGFPNENLTIAGFGQMPGIIWTGRTNSNGEYTGHAAAGHTYLATSAAEGHFPQWFDHKTNPIEANRLSLGGDTSGINFDLLANPAVQNSISGQVLDSNSTGIPSHVVLFRRSTIGPRAILHTVTDSLGNYQFRYLRNEIYYLKAMPFFGYAPAWYKAGSFGVTDWHDADSVRAIGNVSGITIGVVPVPEGGIASIAGSVSDNLSQTVAGAVVYAFTVSTNTIAGYGISDANGTYRLENLAPGDYRVIVDKEGFVPAGTWTYELSSTNNYQVNSALLRITPATPTGVRLDPGAAPLQFKLDPNYPNPFNPSTEMSFSVPVASSVKLAVYNLLGQEIASLVNENLDAGVYTTRWDGRDNAGENVSSGLYFYKITAIPREKGGAIFERVRKMLMLK